MRALLIIAHAEITFLLRSRLALVSALIFAACLIVATLTSSTFLAEERAHRAAHQSDAEEILEAQPDRHPHRMVHYGHYVFRPPPALATIDPGLDAYGGTSVFLEGHRQNAAMFAAATEGSVLVRFGNLTPAFVLQVLAPLLLILLGHASMTREREMGTVRALMAQGMSVGSIAGGKFLVLLGVVGLSLAILGVAAIIPVFSGDEAILTAVSLVLTYAIYLSIWAVIVVTVSLRARRGGSALIVLAALWLATTIIVPRVAADIARTAAPLESAFSRDMKLRAAIYALGDSHDTSDPTFGPFRQRILDQYGVDRIEDLPVNYKGLLAAEGERLGAEVIARFNAEDVAARKRQQGIILLASAMSPFIAIQQASQRLVGTDLAGYHRFVLSAEKHRLTFVQALNMMQSNEVDYGLDTIKSVDVQAERATRVSAEAWAKLPKFRYTTVPATDRLNGTLALICVLILWLAGAIVWFARSTRRVEP